MRKTTFVTSPSFGIPLFFLGALCSICLAAFAQDAPPAAVPATALPSDPKELMLLAAKTNGLTGADVQPWHAKATYNLLDEAGNIKEQGSCEEFWVSPTKFKRIFTGASYSQTQYGTEKGILVSGAVQPLAMTVDMRREFFDPFVNAQGTESKNFDLQQKDTGVTKLDCLSLKYANGNPFGLTWCLGADKPILRLSALPNGTRIVHNGTLGFQSRFIARDLKFIRDAKPIFTAHLDSIELISSIDEAMFIPPPDAKTMMKTVNIAAGVAQGYLIKAEPPEYPIYAKQTGVSGTVVLQANIDKEGHIADLRVVEGPSELQEAAMKAVKKWIYRPYLLNGQPVEVLTTINVVFTLGRNPG